MTIITLAQALKNLDDEAARCKMADIELMQSSDPVGKELWSLIAACECCQKSWDEWDHEFYRVKHDDEYEYDREKLYDSYVTLGKFIVDHTEVLNR